MPIPVVKKDLILEYEKGFAYELGLAILPKPKISFWMILIPIFFVFHIHYYKRNVKGRQDFVENYMISRRWAVDEAMEAIRQDRPVDVDVLSVKAVLPTEEAHREYRRWVAVLMTHYRDLLTSPGEDLISLVRHAYGSRSNYLLTLNQLSEAEKKLNASLRSDLEKEAADIVDVIANIEFHTSRLRRMHAETVFP